MAISGHENSKTEVRRPWSLSNIIANFAIIVIVPYKALVFEIIFAKRAKKFMKSKRMPSLYYNQKMPEEKYDLSEEVALINAAKTNPDAFGLLYERYVERIYNYIYFRVGSRGDAEDLTARVFFKALKSIGGYRHMGLPFSAWLYRIAHNLVANYHRDRSKIQVISIENLVLHDTDRHAAPEEVIEAKQENDYLLELISDLTPQKRELIVLKFVHKLSNEEIGKIFGKTEGAVKSLYHRTLVELKERAKQNTDRRIP